MNKGKSHAFVAIAAALMVVIAITAVPVMAAGQRMVIFNSTGNSTDASGTKDVGKQDVVPEILTAPGDIIKEPSAENATKPKNATLAEEYPATQKVIIPQGAALKGDGAYMPNPVKINRGGVVTWINADTVTHTVTYGKGFTDPEMGKYFDSGLVGSSYNKKFDTAGNYSYFCQVHPQMVGLVVVKATEQADELVHGNKTSSTIISNSTSLPNDTVDRPQNAVVPDDGSDNLLDGIINFFKGLFG